jgi:hypothetical protein
LGSSAQGRRKSISDNSRKRKMTSLSFLTRGNTKYPPLSKANLFPNHATFQENSRTKAVSLASPSRR